MNYNWYHNHTTWLNIDFSRFCKVQRHTAKFKKGTTSNMVNGTYKKSMKSLKYINTIQYWNVYNTQIQEAVIIRNDTWYPLNLFYHRVLSNSLPLLTNSSSMGFQGPLSHWLWIPLSGNSLSERQQSTFSPRSGWLNYCGMSRLIFWGTCAFKNGDILSLTTWVLFDIGRMLWQSCCTVGKLWYSWSLCLLWQGSRAFSNSEKNS